MERIDLENVYFLVKFLIEIDSSSVQEFREDLFTIILNPYKIGNKYYYIGVDLSGLERILIIPGDEYRKGKVELMELWEFLEKFKDYSPELIISDEYYSYDKSKSEAFDPERHLVKHKDPDFKEFLRNLLFNKGNSKNKRRRKEFMVILKDFKQKKEILTDEFKKKKDIFVESSEESQEFESYKVPKWLNCPLCISLANHEYEAVKGMTIEGGGIPLEESFLKLLGAPYYDDSRSYSHLCLKQCPICGTYYLWKFKYEYFANGSEEELDLIRLSDEEGRDYYKNLLNKIPKKSKI
ncbi:MAG: hypothetical protein ACTSU2_06290 [Promethearchaeota archaeon]